MTRHSPIPTSSRRGFLAVLGAGTASVIAPVALAGIPAPVAETSTADLPTSRATPSPDAALLQIVDDYLAADAERLRLRAIVERARKKQQAANPMPDVLLVRPEDADLGLPEVPEIRGQPLAYHYRIFKLKQPQWWLGVVPSAAARARADEIIKAHAKWDAKYSRLPREVRSIDRKADLAFNLQERLLSKIERTPALTVEGLVAKAKVAACEGREDAQFADTVLASIQRDLLALDGRAQS